MQTGLIERLTDFAIWAFLWAFRIAVVGLVVIGSALTIASGKYSLEVWVDLLVQGLILGSVYSLIALGYTMVYGILRLINFAHGEVFTAGAFGGYFVATALLSMGLLNQSAVASLVSVAVMILGSMLVATVVALTVERIAYRPLRTAPGWCRSSAPSAPRTSCSTPCGGSSAPACTPIRR